MKASEIRALSVDISATERVQNKLLREIAAQLAEINDKLLMIAHPPFVVHDGRITGTILGGHSREQEANDVQRAQTPQHEEGES